MPSFSDKSQSLLNSAHKDLQIVCYDVIEIYDFTVLETFRTDERQEAMFRDGKSKLRGGESKHNTMPASAIDIAPYPINWDDAERFYLLAGMMFMAAKSRGIFLRWGGDWDQDWEHADQTFDDLPHFELIRGRA